MASSSRIYPRRWVNSWHMVLGMVKAGISAFTLASKVKGKNTPEMPHHDIPRDSRTSFGAEYPDFKVGYSASILSKEACAVSRSVSMGGFIRLSLIHILIEMLA